MAKNTTPLTINSSIQHFLESLPTKSTTAAYTTGMKHFKDFITIDLNLSLDHSPAPFDHRTISGFIKHVGSLTGNNGALAASSQGNYITAVMQYLIYIDLYFDEIEINTNRLRTLVKKESPKQITTANAIDVNIEAVHVVLDYARNLHNRPLADTVRHPKRIKLANYRDRALILLLAATGARIGKEALQLNRSSIDWRTGKAQVLGKGNKKGELTIGPETKEAIQEYLSQLKKPTEDEEEKTRKRDEGLPLFIRHDPKSGDKILRLGYTSALRSLTSHFQTALEEAKMPNVIMTPHHLRHYFVTNILNTSGGNLVIAKINARHVNINTTSKYAHVDDDEADAINLEAQKSGKYNKS